jgi:hypothetical protein
MNQTARVPSHAISRARVSDALEAKRYPACRLVLTSAAAIDLFNRLQQTMTAPGQTGGVSQQKTQATGLGVLCIERPRLGSIIEPMSTCACPRTGRLLASRRDVDCEPHRRRGRKL